MNFGKAKLEHWMREHYFDCDIDLGSSGVYPYTLGDIFAHTDLNFDDLAAVELADSTTVGNIDLRTALAKRYGNGNPDSVMLGNGSNEVLFHILSTLLEEGDEVVALDPIYHALDAVPIAKNCDIKRWNMDPELSFRVSLSELRSIVTDKTKLIAVNFPHNPTGVSISLEEQRELIEIASHVGAYLVWDAAFEELTSTSKLINPFLEYSRSIYVGTLSKSYGMPGLRVGWCFANKGIIKSFIELRDYTTLYVSPVIESIATKVIENADFFINQRLDTAETNKHLMKRWVEEHRNLVSWSDPVGGVSCLIKIKSLANTDEFCTTISKKYGVMLVPGSCFGLPEFIRVGFGEQTDKFKEGLNLLSTHIQSHVNKLEG